MLYKEWVKLIEEFKASGKSQAQWCREKNLKVKAFNYQYRKDRKDNKTNIPEVNKTNWLPVELKPVILSKLSIRVGKAVIEIENGYDERLMFIEVSPTFSVDYTEQIFADMWEFHVGFIFVGAVPPL